MRKGQTAMEYLMTYGWAILIIMIVLVVLFYLGVLNPAVPVQCTFPSGFTCISSKIDASDGNLTLVIGEGTGHTIVITGVNCSDNMSSGYTPNIVFYGDTNNNVTMNSGSQEQVAYPTGPLQVLCTHAYNGADTAISQQTVGATYSGNIYINYTEVDTGTNHIVVGSYTADYESG
jgi:hypothetical protein